MKAAILETSMVACCLEREVLTPQRNYSITGDIFNK